MPCQRCPTLFFFFHDTATPEIYTLSLHDALPICTVQIQGPVCLANRSRIGPVARQHQRTAVLGLHRSLVDEGLRLHHDLAPAHVRRDGALVDDTHVARPSPPTVITNRPVLSAHRD